MGRPLSDTSFAGTTCTSSANPHASTISKLTHCQDGLYNCRHMMHFGSNSSKAHALRGANGLDNRSANDSGGADWQGGCSKIDAQRSFCRILRSLQSACRNSELADDSAAPGPRAVARKRLCEGSSPTWWRRFVKPRDVSQTMTTWKITVAILEPRCH